MDLFEIPREVALIMHSNPVHDLFCAQERRLQKRPGLLHPERLEELCACLPGFRFEEIA